MTLEQLDNLMHDLNPVSIAVRCLLAVIIGGLIGINRERKHRPAGFRTHMLVCLGSAMIMMISQYVIKSGWSTDMTRMGAQVISGIGFLGAGTIIITGRYQVRGLTTAAGLWASACIGLAIGIGFYYGALIGFAFIVAVVSCLNGLSNSLKKNSKYVQLYIEFDSADNLGVFLRFLKEKEIEVDELEVGKSKVSSGLSVFAIANLKYKRKTTHADIIEIIGTIPGIHSIEEI